jgi:tetratricopeptide (TPR) repeat protein
MATPSKKEQQERKNALKAASKERTLVRWQMIVLAAAAFLLYAQTLRFGLVMDDNMVITDHSVVQQGVKGIGTLLTKDSFYGFDEFYDRSSQRKTYRPVSFVSFAIEKQLWNNNPAAAHFVNVLLYTITVGLVFMLLRRLFAKIIDAEPHFAWLPFSAALLFAVHPVHTAVVANIKSRDEIFALMFAVLSAIWFFDYARLQRSLYAALSIIAAALALLSKESAQLLIPILAYLAMLAPTGLDVRKRRIITLSYALVYVVYAIVWFSFVGRVEEGLFAYKFHNPFVGASFGERVATGVMLLGYYLQKAIFPWTLSEGYTYNQIPIVGIGDWRVFASVAVFAVLIALPLFPLGDTKNRRWQSIVSLCVIAFLFTLAIASNLVVYSGSMLGERFVFTPSLFIVIALAYSVFAVFGAESKNFRRTFALGTILVFASVYAVRGLMRLPDWASDYKLLLADHRSTPESMMTARNFASQLIMRAGRTENPTEQSILLDEAELVLSRALKVDSSADAALYDLQALIALQRKDAERAFILEKQAMVLDSATRDSIHRKPIFLRNLASAYVSRAARRINTDNPDSTNLGIADLRTALQLNPMNENAYLNLGMIYGKQQKFDSALAYFQAAYRVNPQSQVAQQYIYAIQQARREETEELELKAQQTNK